MGLAVLLGGAYLTSRLASSGEEPLLPPSYRKVLGRWIIAMCMVFVPLDFFKPIQQLFAIESDLTRALFTLVAWPFAREIATMVIRKASFDLRGHDVDADQLLVMMIHAFGALTTRFLVNNMQTLGGTIAVIVVQALVEVVLRQTVTKRDRWVFVHIGRHSNEQADRRFKNAHYLRNRGRVVLAEMVVEYVAILLCPTIMIMYEPYRRFINFGYKLNTPLDLTVLMAATAAQLVSEIVVDSVCLYFEDKAGIPVLNEWNKLSRKKRWKIYVLGLGINVLVSYICMVGPFIVEVPSDCLPNPCTQCVVEGAGREHLDKGGSLEEIMIWCQSNFLPNGTKIL